MNITTLGIILALGCIAVFTLNSFAAEGKHKCSDFATQAEAQRVFEQAGGPKVDPYRMDRDKDGVACEGLLKKSKKVKK